jgi:hypothetical protein
LLDDERS